MPSFQSTPGAPRSASPTTGVRTWRRTEAGPAASLADRVTETTDGADMATALQQADFVTVPRLGIDAAGTDHTGYDDAYAEALLAALQQRYGYAGGRRVSTSGRSHVFEREAVLSGCTVDFGLPAGLGDASGTGRAHTGAQGLVAALGTAALGDGAARGVPALATAALATR